MACASLVSASYGLAPPSLQARVLRRKGLMVLYCWGRFIRVPASAENVALRRELCKGKRPQGIHRRLWQRAPRDPVSREACRSPVCPTTTNPPRPPPTPMRPPGSRIVNCGLHAGRLIPVSGFYPLRSPYTTPIGPGTQRVKASWATSCLLGVSDDGAMNMENILNTRVSDKMNRKGSQYLRGNFL